MWAGLGSHPVEDQALACEHQLRVGPGLPSPLNLCVGRSWLTPADKATWTP